MSIFTVWYAADDDAIEVALEGVFEGSRAHLGGVSEAEMLLLGDVLAVPYEPSAAHDDLVALRVNTAFLEALIAIPASAVPDVVARWQQRAAHLADTDASELEETFRAMQRCAREGLAGPGVLSIPAS
jgi:hypothetical protein